MAMCMREGGGVCLEGRLAGLFGGRGGMLFMSSGVPIIPLPCKQPPRKCIPTARIEQQPSDRSH